MNEDSFFETLETQYKNKLPFVVYSRPINSIIKCWLQNDAILHSTKNFTESGFVFAPFDLSNKTILLPQEKCKHAVLEIDTLNVEEKTDVFTANETTKNEHVNLVSKGLEIIQKGDLEKVVLSRVEAVKLKENQPISIFKRLFNTYKNAMVYCWYHPKIGLWLGATPELLFKVEGKQLTSISLAGTKLFKANEVVKWKPKEIEEQQIVTNYITKSLQPYTAQITIKPFETIRAGNLMHLKTYIISKIKERVSLQSIIATLHPTPAVCGFPKQDAKDFILQNENYNREYYTGFLGELNLKQTTSRNANRRNIENNAYAIVKTQSNFYVNLRCMQIKANQALLYVGGGITKDSVAMDEWKETVNKTKTIGSILNIKY